jgi:hypothetical protein
MGLRVCTQCTNRVSTNAAACPKCKLPAGESPIQCGTCGAYLMWKGQTRRSAVLGPCDSCGEPNQSTIGFGCTLVLVLAVFAAVAYMAC